MNHSENITGFMVRKRLERNGRHADYESQQEFKKEIDVMFSDRSTKEERSHYFILGKLYFLGYMGMGYFLFIITFLLNLALLDNNPYLNYLVALPGSLSFLGYLTFNAKEKANSISAASYTKTDLFVSIAGGLVLAGVIAYLTQLI